MAKKLDYPVIDGPMAAMHKRLDLAEKELDRLHERLKLLENGHTNGKVEKGWPEPKRGT